MKITKAEWAAILSTLVLLAFAAGFFFGRTTLRAPVVVEAAAPEPSGAVAASVETVQPEETAEAVESVPEQEASTKAVESILEQEASFEAEESILEQEASAASAEESGLLDLNAATAAELEALPKIGPVLAQRILDYRRENGGFTEIEELKNVDGIGDKTYDAIKNMVEVGN